MLGITVNGVVIVTGSLLGQLFGSKLSSDFQKLLNNVLGLSALMVGVSTATKAIQASDYAIFYIIVLVIGAIIGQFLDLNGKITRLFEVNGSEGAEGIIAGITILCVGTLPILGPLQMVLSDDPTYLLVNIMFSFVVSLSLATSYGMKISLVAPILVTIEFVVYIFAGYINQIMTPTILNEMELVGGILTVASGLNLLQLTRIPVLNLLPSLILPFVLIFL